MYPTQLRYLRGDCRHCFSVLTLPDGDGFGPVTFRGTKSGSTHSVPLGRFATWLMRER
jgi:hypothetical protein